MNHISRAMFFISKHRAVLTLALLLVMVLVPHLGATREMADYGQGDPTSAAWQTSWDTYLWIVIGVGGAVALWAGTFFIS